MISVLQKCGKNSQEGRRMGKSCLMILLRFEEISLRCGNMGSHHFAEFGLHFSDMCGIKVPTFESKWHVLVQHQAKLIYRVWSIIPPLLTARKCVPS